MVFGQDADNSDLSDDPRDPVDLNGDNDDARHRHAETTGKVAPIGTVIRPLKMYLYKKDPPPKHSKNEIYIF